MIQQWGMHDIVHLPNPKNFIAHSKKLNECNYLGSWRLPGSNKECNPSSQVYFISMKQLYWRGQGMCTGRCGDPSNFGKKWAKETVKKLYIIVDRVFPMESHSYTAIDTSWNWTNKQMYG